MLHYAALAGKSDVIDILMTQGAVCGDNYLFAVAVASMAVTSVFKSILISFFQTVDVEDDCEQTPLYYACIKGRRRAAELLCLNQANLNHCDARGMSPLHHAAKHGHNQCIELLLRKGFLFVGL